MSSDQSRQSRLIVKLDVKNAFNTVRRHHLLRVSYESTLPIAGLAHLAYSYPSTVLASDHPICSAAGIQQCDPLGPVLFAMTVDEVASSLSTEINIWYLNDATLGGPAKSVFADVRKCVTQFKKIDLEVNPSKCEIINMSYPVDELTELVTTIASDLPGLKRTKLENKELLDSAILDQVVKKAIVNNLFKYTLMVHRLRQLDTHTGFFLRKNAFSLPRPHATIISPDVASVGVTGRLNLFCCTLWYFIDLAFCCCVILTIIQINFINCVLFYYLIAVRT